MTTYPSRRQFLASTAVAGTWSQFPFALTKTASQTKASNSLKIPLGFDNFSIRAKKWKAEQLIDFAAQQELDALLLSDLDVYRNHQAEYLAGLKAKAEDSGIRLHAGTGGICPTSQRFIKKYGTAEEHLRLGIRIAQAIGSPVFRCYLGSMDDRKTEGGIEKHIEQTVAVLKTVRTQAEDAGVKIAVENHAGDMQAYELVELIKAAGESFVGATIDSGNATWTLEEPAGNLEILGPYAVSSGMRDSTVWMTDNGAKVAWNAIGEGQVDWKAYCGRFAKLCPNVPFQLEIISGFNREFPFKKPDFWSPYRDCKAAEFERFLQLARHGKPVAAGKAGDADYQTAELLRSIDYCKQELGLGLK